MKDFMCYNRVFITLFLFVLLVPLLFNVSPAAGLSSAVPHGIYGTVTFNGDAVDCADVHVVSSIGQRDTETATDGTYYVTVSISTAGDIVIVSAMHPDYGYGEFSFIPTTGATMVDIDLQPQPMPTATTTPAVTTPVAPSGDPHSVYGTITCNGFPQADASSHVSSSMGAWDFSTMEDGRYGCMILISGQDDLITIVASRPDCGSGQGSALAQGSNTRIDIDIAAPAPTTTTVTQTTATTTVAQQGIPHSVYGTITCDGVGQEGASVHVTTSSGTWDFSSLTGGTYGGMILVSDLDGTITVTATYAGYRPAQGSSAPVASATNIDLDLLLLGMPQGIPHSVYGTITCEGTGQEGAPVHITTGSGAWDFTLLTGGTYGGTILVSSPDDTITVTATYAGH